MRASFFGVIAVLLCMNAHAVMIEQPLPDAAQEQQARELFGELKCVVCEGQSLAESDAKLAVQMRAHIRTMIGQGKSPQEVLAFFRDSYGERILMQPPLTASTMLVWCMPLLLLFVGALLLWRAVKGRNL